MLSNTAVPIYYGKFRDQVMRGEIPVNETISLEMQRIDDLIDDPRYYYDNKAVNGYINSDLAVVIERAKKSGDSNKLGLAYVRAGQYSNAKTEFAKGAAANNISAMNNLGNVYMIEKNYSAAEKQYKQILAIDPNNKSALKGLENVRSVLGD